MGQRGLEPPRPELLGEGIERPGVLAEECDVEDGLWTGKFEALEVGVEAELGGAKVGDSSGGGDTCADLIGDVRMVRL